MGRSREMRLPRTLPEPDPMSLPILALVASTLSIIDGQSDPSALGFELSSSEQNAIVAQLFDIGGERVQGCTGNIVHDRIVIAAAHCVVKNQEAWTGGAEPVLVTPDELLYAVGPDIRAPLCTLHVAEVHLDANNFIDNQGWIHHDVSIMVLSESVADTCPDVTPLAIHRAALSDTELSGEEMLFGGFGSLDESFNFSPQRIWSKLSYVGAAQGPPDDMIWFFGIDAGAPSFGDSGAGVLRRNSEGTLEVMGLMSFSGENQSGRPMYGFPRVDLSAENIDAIIATLSPPACDTCEDVPDPKPEDENGGCASMGSNGSLFGFCALALCMRRRRAD